MELADPYRGNSLYSVVNMTAELVDEKYQPVPLSEVGHLLAVGQSQATLLHKQACTATPLTIAPGERAAVDPECFGNTADP